MMEKFKRLDKSAKIRLFVFLLLLGWSLYLGIGFAAEANLGKMSTSFVDTSEVKDISIDGSDFTWAVLLMGYGVNGLLSLLFLVLTVIYALAEAVLTLIPALMLRFIGVKETAQLSKEEYTITKYMYRGALVISLVGGLIASRLTGIVFVLLYTGIWALTALIYVERIKSRSR